MAYTVSLDYLTQMQDLARSPRAYIQIGQTEIHDDGDLIKFKIDAFLQKDGSLFGNTPAKYIRVELQEANKYSFQEGTEFTAYLGLTLNRDTPQETVEYIPQGVFIITTIERDTVNNKLVIDAYDSMILFNEKFDGTISYPITLGALADQLCGEIGIELDSLIFMNSLIEITEPINITPNESTYRDLIGWIAELAGSNAVLTRDNKLKIVEPGDVPVAAIVGDNYFEFEITEHADPIDSIYITHMPENDSIHAPDPLPENENPYTMVNNAIAYFNRDAIIDDVLNSVLGFEHTGFTLKWRGFYFLDLGDRLTLVDIDGGIYNSYVFNYSLEYDGSTVENLWVDVYSQTEIDSRTSTGIRDLIQETRFIVDKANNTINSVVSSVETIEGTINSIEGDVLSAVGENYVDKDSYEAYQQSVSTQFEQTPTSFQFTFLEGKYTDLNGALNEEIEARESHILFDNGTITLGDSESNLKLVLDNDRISFLENNGTEVMYITNNVLYITNGEFLDSLRVGNFGYTPRTNGSLSFGKVK